MLATLLTAAIAVSDFKSDQMRHERVKAAFNEKSAIARDLFKGQGLPFPCPNVFLRSYKHDKVVELWAAPSSRSKYRLVKSYPVLAASGGPGPKRIEGDKQVPEGFYEITTFNPTSQFWLSLRVNYPNASDRILSDKDRPGSDIYIHGNQVSLGCLALGDEAIKELYVILVEARSAGQRRLPVHIFPFKMGGESFERMAGLFSVPDQAMAFWRNLKQGHDLFESRKRPPSVSVARDGTYRFR